MSEFEDFWEEYNQDEDLGQPIHSLNDKILAESIWEIQQQKINLMQTMIYELKKSNEFYSNKFSWTQDKVDMWTSTNRRRIIDSDIETTEYYDMSNACCKDHYGGKLARQAQQRIKQLEDELRRIK